MLRGCSRTLKTPNSPPLITGAESGDSGDLYLKVKLHYGD